MSAADKSFASYVPALVAQRFPATASPPTEPHAEYVTGAVLFADISGFTALTESLARRGPSGAEELTHCLNVYLGQLIDLISEHGGDVIKFAGDALLALWPTGEDDLAAATERAAYCGLRAQKRLHNFQAAPDVRLSLRIGIGAGPVSLFHVGGFEGRWEMVAAGASLTQMSAAKEQDRPGDVTISAEAWLIAGDRMEGEPMPSGAVRLRATRELVPRPLMLPTSINSTALMAYVPPTVVYYLQSGQSGWLAELRTVSVLFVNFPGLTPITPLDRAQMVMQRLQTILNRYEGVINKISIDDKGASLIAALGLPPLAHEDDPARAVGVALAIRERLLEMNVHHAIGIASGLAFCGVVGNDVRREYTMMGDAVNLAARLMQAAPDSILCDQATYEGCRSRVAFEPPQTIFVKGKSAPLNVYRPLQSGIGSAEPRNVRTGAIVGRLAERQAINDALVALNTSGAGATLVLEGDAGIGKSRLLEELAGGARDAGLKVLMGDGDAMEQSTAYLTWRSVFLQLFDLESGASKEHRAETVTRRIAAAGRPEWTALLPLVNPVLMLDLADTDATSSMSDRDRAAATQEFLTDLLLNLPGSASGTVVIIEDAQWMDSSSWSLAVRVSVIEAPILLALPVRATSGGVREEVGVISNLPRTRIIRLGPLSSNEATDVARQVLGVARLPEPVAHVISAKAEGNPLFIEQLVNALRDTQLIQIADGECRIAPAAGNLRSVVLPDTVQAAVMARIDRLSASQRMLLKIASVVGRVFELGVVEHLSRAVAGYESIAEDLGALTAMQITALQRSDPSPAYAFSQLIFQEVNYNLMLFSQRRQLHRAMAEWLERDHADRLEAVYPLLATHWSKAVDETTDAALLWKAVDYLQKAGEGAVRQYANHEAIAFLNEGLRLVRSLPDTPERTRKELVLCCTIGSPLVATKGFAAPETERAYARAWELCRQMEETPERFGTVLGLWSFYLVKTELRRALELAEELVRIATAAGDTERQLTAHRAMGEVLFWVGNPTAARDQFERVQGIYRPEAHHAKSIARNGQDPGVICLGQEGWCLWLLGYPDQAIATIEKALALAKRLQHPFSVALVLMNYAMTNQFRREPRQVLEKAEMQIELAHDAGFVIWAAGGAIMRGWALSELGQLDLGRAEMRRGIDEWRATGAELAVGYYLSLLANAHGSAGEPERGLELIRSMRDAANRSGEAWWLPELWRLEGELSLALPNADERHVERCLKEALDMARRHQTRALELRAAMSLCRLWRRQDKLDEAQRSLADVTRWFTEGRETADLMEAEQLLAAGAGRSRK